MVAHIFFTNDYARRRHVDQLQVSINELVSSNNSLSFHILGIKTKVTLEKSKAKTQSSKQNEILDELKYSYFGVTDKLSELDEKT